MLGKDSVENYHPKFIMKLIDFSNQLDFAKLSKSNPDFVVSLSEKWPSKL